MARQTTNYGLTKPDYTDIADIEVVNANMDIIDRALKVIDTKSNNVMSKNSSAWSSTVAYAVGQYCIYNNSLWKCLVQHSGQTPQEGTYWTRVSLDTLGSEINALNSKLVKRKTVIKTISNQTYAIITGSELNIDTDFIFDVNIERNPNYGYHFVAGHGFDSSGNLFVYFDGAINATVTIMIYYVIL